MKKRLVLLTALTFAVAMLALAVVAMHILSDTLQTVNAMSQHNEFVNMHNDNCVELDYISASCMISAYGYRTEYQCNHNGCTLSVPAFQIDNARLLETRLTFHTNAHNGWQSAIHTYELAN